MTKKLPDFDYKVFDLVQQYFIENTLELGGNLLDVGDHLNEENRGIQTIALGNLFEEKLHELFDSADADKDGTVFKYEFKARADEVYNNNEGNIYPLKKFIPENGLSRRGLNAMALVGKAAILNADVDKNGFIDASEIKIPVNEDSSKLYKKLAPEINRRNENEAMPQNLAALDLNSDNYVSLKEVKEVMHKAYGENIPFQLIQMDRIPDQPPSVADLTNTTKAQSK